MIFNKNKAFYKLLRIRMVEEEIAKKYGEQGMRCPAHFSIGQEAIAVALSERLKVNDYVVGAHRSHAYYLAKGGNLCAMVSEFYGKATGCAAGRGGSMHLVDQNVGFLGCVPIVGSTIPIGVGVAFGSKLQKKRNVNVAFFGDGATEEGVFYESLNFSVINKLPIIFLCENNLYSVYTHLSCRRKDNMAIMKIAEGFGLDTYLFDGQDCSLLLEKFADIIDCVRNTSKPVFVQCNTYRYLEHCGPESSDSRPAEEVNYWLNRDPVKIFAKDLLEEGSISKEEIEKFKTTISDEIKKAFDYAESAPFPSRSDLNKFVFKE